MVANQREERDKYIKGEKYWLYKKNYKNTKKRFFIRKMEIKKNLDKEGIKKKWRR